MSEKNLAKADFYTSIILIVFGIAAARMAMQMPLADPGMHSVYSSAGLVPGILGVIITVFGTVLFFRSLIKNKGAVGISLTGAKAVFLNNTTLRIICTAALCLLYIFFLGRIIFPLITFLFIFGFIVFFEYERQASFMAQRKKIMAAAAVALIASFAITALFQYVFFVRLP